MCSFGKGLGGYGVRFSLRIYRILILALGWALLQEPLVYNGITAPSPPTTHPPTLQELLKETL